MQHKYLLIQKLIFHFLFFVCAFFLGPALAGPPSANPRLTAASTLKLKIMLEKKTATAELGESHLWSTHNRLWVSKMF